MSKCPFNASHVIPDEEYRNHIEICPDKAWLECQRGIATNSNTNFSPSTDHESSFPKPTSDGANIFCNEDWDQETFASSSANKSFQVKNKMNKTMEPTSEFKMKMLQSLEIEAKDVKRRPANKPRALPFAGIGRGRVVLNPGVGQHKFAKPPASELTKDFNKMINSTSASFCQEKVKLPDGCDSNNNKEIGKVSPGTDDVVCQSVAAVEEKKEIAEDDASKEQKMKRKLVKLIRQIAKIEEKQESGVALNPDEIKKLKKRVDIQRLLEGV